MVILIAGPSGVGKNTLISRIVDHCAIRFEVPYTTRNPRAGEIEGKDYFFISDVEFQQRIRASAFVDWDFTVGNYYGFVPSLVDDSLQPVITHCLARMAIRIRTKYPDRVKLLFLRPLSLSLTGERLRERGIGEAEFNARLEHGREELIHAAIFDHILSPGSIDGVFAQCQACFIEWNLRCS